MKNNALKILSFIMKHFLFVSIVFWVLLAVGAFILIEWLWTGWFIFEPFSLSEDVDRFETVAVALIVVGGIGAVSYLVIRYQERSADKRAEDRELEDRVERSMISAITMLGDKDAPSTRIAGVYALADIADTHRKSFKQRVVDILCGYLRTNRTNDKAVEATILEVLRKHFTKLTDEVRVKNTNVRQGVRDEQLWCDCAIDLHGAVFNEIVPFHYCTFDNWINFSEATFCDNCSFISTSFNRGGTFAKATFREVVFFYDSVIHKEVVFTEVRFEKDAGFNGTTNYADADYGDVVFEGNAEFMKARFAKNISFSGTRFFGKSFFESVVFEGKANFQNTVFKEEANFQNAIFLSSVSFSGATKQIPGEDANFDTSKKDFQEVFIANRELNCFENIKLSTMSSIFMKHVDFTNATFYGKAFFYDVIFQNYASFTQSTFKNIVDFRFATFIGKDTDFLGVDARTSAKRSFRGASFESEVFFHRTKFEPQPNFEDALFAKDSQIDFPKEIILQDEGPSKGLPLGANRQAVE